MLQFRVVFACKWKKKLWKDKSETVESNYYKNISITVVPCPKYDPKIPKTSFMPILSGWTVPLYKNDDTITVPLDAYNNNIYNVHTVQNK